jgi:hypothetical protein
MIRYKSLKISPETHRKLSFVKGFTGFDLGNTADDAICEYLEKHYKREMDQWRIIQTPDQKNQNNQVFFETGDRIDA